MYVCTPKKMMKLRGKIPLIIVAAFAWIIIISSCANPGMPIGGAKDTIPPVLVKTSPVYKSTEFDGEKIELTFNEYINTEEISEALVISPPMQKKPVIKTRSKTLIVEFREELKDSVTYSLDFKNTVADNNEKNPIENFRFSFSTGPVYDSLRVSGNVADAFSLEPIKDGLVLLQKNLHDSAVFKLTPDYIAKTNEEGMFMIDNIAPGTYHLFSVADDNNNFLYDEGAERISYYDSMIVPSAKYIEQIDTIRTATDTIVVMGHTQFFPDPVYLHLFSEDIYNQFLKNYKRETRYKFTLVFNKSVKDSFQLNLLNYKSDRWYQMECDEKMDSLIVWIADTTAARIDTLLAEVAYLQLDSTKQLQLKKDTLSLEFSDPEKSKTQKRKKDKDTENKPEPIEQFAWQLVSNTPNVELNKSYSIISPEPIFSFDSTKIRLFHSDDTLKTQLKFKFVKDSVEWRRYNIEYKWEPATAYTFEIDSSAFTNIFGITNKKLVSKFESREEDFYGSLELLLTGVKVPLLIQMVTNDDNEKVVEQRRADRDGKVSFKYLLPEKYKVKVIYDRNGNGKWDTGSYQDKFQPERVVYINEVQKVRSNWEEMKSWDLTPDPKFLKKVRDPEQEEKLRKEAEEKKKKESQQRDKPQQMQNLMQGGGGGVGSGMFN